MYLAIVSSVNGKPTFIRYVDIGFMPPDKFTYITLNSQYLGQYVLNNQSNIAFDSLFTPLPNWECLHLVCSFAPTLLQQVDWDRFAIDLEECFLTGRKTVDLVKRPECHTSNQASPSIDELLKE